MSDVTPPEADVATQAAVLGLLLDLYPAPLTLDELLLELACIPEDFGQRDDLERAVRDLARAGLLHCHRTLHGRTVFLFPTRSAVRFSELPVT